MDNEMFDRLLDDVLKNVTEKVISGGTEALPSSIHIALWDEKDQSHRWASADVIEYPEDQDEIKAVLASAGVLVIESGFVPIAAYWTKRARMEVDEGDKTIDYTGVIILGMTDDHRVNGGFLAVDTDDQPIGAKMFYASSMNDKNTMDAGDLYHLFKAARAAYRKRKDDPNLDELTKGLFRNVKGFDNKE